MFGRRARRKKSGLGTQRASTRFAVMRLLALISTAVPAAAQPFAYVANLGSDDVTVIDTASNTVVATIAVGSDPDGVAVSPDGKRVYVSNFGSHNVSVIDTERQAVAATISVGRGPVGLAASRSDGSLLVTNREDDSVSIINPVTNRVTATVAVGKGPDAVAITADGARAYVTNSSSTEPGIVSVIDPARGREVERITVLRNPNRVALAPNGGTAYVTNYRSWNVSLIVTADHEVVDTIRVYRKPSGIAVNPNSAFVYIVGKHGDVSVVDTALRYIVNGLAVPGRADGIGVTRTGATACVTNFDVDSVTVIDLTHETVVGTIGVGDQPFAVGVNCVGRGCTDPPFTRIPTATPTPVPTQPPTATRTATPTLPASVPRVILSISQVSGRPGEQIALSVTLHTNGLSVAGTQADLHISAALIDETSIRCRVNPAIDKHSTAFAIATIGDDVRLRSVVLSLENTNPILDGALLYTCSARLAADAPSGRFPIAVDNVGAATPDGGALPTVATEGRIDVLSSVGARAVTASDGGQRLTLCSRGPNDGMPCGELNDCQQGLCLVAQGVCDAGADDGLLCDCPGGRCMPSGDTGTCVGGGSDGTECDTDTNCAGNRACVGTHQLCQRGAARGMACLRDAHCVDAECRSSPGLCAYGTFAGYACNAHADCPGGECYVPAFADSLPSPTPAHRLPATATDGDGCAIASTSADNRWLIALGLALALIARRRGVALKGHRSPRISRITRIWREEF